jgi:hypothetical protein
VNCSAVNGNESLGVEKMEQLVKEVVRIIPDETQKIINIFSNENSSLSSKGCRVANNITGILPEPPDAIECMQRKATALANVIQAQ